MSIRRKIVAGNWKMNTTASQAMSLVEGIVKQLNKDSDVKVIICPPFVHLSSLHLVLKDLPKLKLGAQNCSQHVSGAYTGEVSAEMLQTVGCNYVIIGHSERRTYFNESNQQLVEKLKRALENNLSPIFCIGEKLEERNAGKHFDVVKDQLQHVLGKFNAKELQHLILAYEPVWAIGTGVTASSAQAQEMHAFIRKTISELFNTQFAQSLSILYGGSCNAQNAKELFACADVDGGLIGGASLKAEDFCKIVASF